MRFHRVLAPNARLRPKVVSVQVTTAGAGVCAHAHSAQQRMSWAQLLKRLFGIEIER